VSGKNFIKASTPSLLLELGCAIQREFFHRLEIVFGVYEYYKYAGYIYTLWTPLSGKNARQISHAIVSGRAIAFPSTTTHRVNTSTTTTNQAPLARVATKVVVVAPQGSLYRIENSLLSKCHLTFIFCSWPNCISSNWVIRGGLKTRELLAKRTLQPISGRMNVWVCGCGRGCGDTLIAHLFACH